MNQRIANVNFTWTPLDLSRRLQTRKAVDTEARTTAARIVNQIRQGDQETLRSIAVELGDISSDQSLVLDRHELQAALTTVPESTREILERTAERIRLFASAQRQSLQDCRMEVPGGFVGHRWKPLASAGCYAPGGRYPLPSSVLMTVVTAKVAGVSEIWVASPRPTAEAIAAAAIAGANGLLCVGGAQAIAALATGTVAPMPECQIIVGPGNRWVTAAKALISEGTRIDMLAGPSELVVVADDSATPSFVAADLLAQAEHDPDAIPILVSNSKSIINLVIEELQTQLGDLPTAATAQQALATGGYILVDSIESSIGICRKLAPEHLSLQGRVVESLFESFDTCGGLFIGRSSGEVLGDYGIGPNHVLPTGGTAQSYSPLWVGTFMKMHTYVDVKDHPELKATVADAAKLARLEGLEAHARSADLRLRALDQMRQPG